MNIDDFKKVKIEAMKAKDKDAVTALNSVINKLISNKVFEVLQGGKSITKTESWLECQNRIREAIKDIVNQYDDNDTVICVTSGVNITAFIGLAYRIPASENLPFPWVPSCSPIGFDIDKSCF